MNPARRVGQIDERMHVLNPPAAPAQDLASRIERMPQLLTARDLYQLLHISRTSLYAKVQSGSIPYVRIGTTIRFDPVRIAAWLRGCEVGSGFHWKEAA